MKLERRIDVEPAFDKRHPDPNKNYGIHGVTIRWLVIGNLGAIQFVVYTNWHLPEVQQEIVHKCHGATGKYDFCRLTPMAADIGYHSYVPQYEGQETITESCPYLNGKPCYYDGSSLQAEEYFEILVREGGEALWVKLEQTYSNRFLGKDKP
jgi:hypothetical protein